MQNPPLLRSMDATSSTDDIRLHAEGLGKRYGDLWALRDLDLDVPSRAPCSACSATTAPARPRPSASSPRCRRPPRARPRVAGFDVVADPLEVRRRIGVAAQQATVDGLLDRPRQPRDGRPAPPPARRPRPRRARRRAARAPRPHRRRRPAGEDLLRRHAPAARPRRQHRGHARRCSSSTSRPPGSTRAAATTCGRCCATSCATAPRSSSPPSTSRRPTAWPTTSSCSTTAEPSPTARPDELKARIGERPRRHHGRAAAELRAVAAAAAERSRRAPPSFDRDAAHASPCPLARGRPRSWTSMRALDAAGVDAVDLNRRQATLDDVFLTLTGRSPEPDAPRHPHRPPPTGSRMTATATRPRPHPPSRAARTSVAAHPARCGATRWSTPAATSQHIRQIPEKLLDVTLQPLMFVLLFAYVFGGAIAVERRQLPRVPHRRHPHAVAGLRHDRPGHVDRHRPAPKA